MKVNVGFKKRATALAMMMVTAGGVVAFTGTAAQAAAPTCTKTGTIGGQVDPIQVPESSSGSYNCQLSKGNNNSAVRLLQSTLVDCYSQSISVDGDFGTNTQAALKRAQAKAGVTADGIYGPNTASHFKFQSLLYCYTIAQTQADG